AMGSTPAVQPGSQPLRPVAPAPPPPPPPPTPSLAPPKASAPVKPAPPVPAVPQGTPRPPGLPNLVANLAPPAPVPPKPSAAMAVPAKEPERTRTTLSRTASETVAKPSKRALGIPIALGTAAVVAIGAIAITRGGGSPPTAFAPVGTTQPQ